ncbi:BRO family protein [Pseudoscardovia radai]|uniref:BRO family protein n=1 Tax=Pseudoscardovia radai TaxID=987066 RepID=UPI0039950242
MAKEKNTGDNHTLATVGASDNVSSFTFTDEDGVTMPVRVLTDEDGEPWFVAKDVCAILGLGNSRQAVASLDEDEKNTVIISDGIPGNPNKTIISEPGLYSLVSRSRKKQAHDFRRWVNHDVLPSIRRTGMYATPQTMDTMLNDPDAFLRLVQDWHDTKITAMRQAKQLEAQQPKVEAYDQYLSVEETMLVRDAVKILSQHGTPIRENRLRQLLKDWKWAYRHDGHWEPTAYAVQQGYLTLTPHAGHGTHRDGTDFPFPPTMRVTRKGLDRAWRKIHDGDTYPHLTAPRITLTAAHEEN